MDKTNTFFISADAAKAPSPTAANHGSGQGSSSVPTSQGPQDGLSQSGLLELQTQPSAPAPVPAAASDAATADRAPSVSAQPPNTEIEATPAKPPQVLNQQSSMLASTPPSNSKGVAPEAPKKSDNPDKADIRFLVNINSRR